MFKSITLTVPLMIVSTSPIEGVFVLEDDEYGTQHFDADTENWSDGSEFLIVFNFYSSRNADIASNIVLYLKKTTPEYCIYVKNRLEIKPYKDEIEKLLLLQ